MRRDELVRRIRGAALVLGLAVGTMPAAASAENVADAMVGAYNTSGLLEQNRALLRAADEDVALAVATLRPVIDWTIRVTRDLRNARVGFASSNTRDTDAFAGLTATWLIYDNGTRNMNVRSAKETVLATRQTLLSVEQAILFRAASAYVNVLLGAENVRLRENNVRVLEEERRAALDRFEVGEVTRTDVALAESRLAAAQSNLAAARGLLENARAEYENAVGRKPGNLAGQPRIPTIPATVDAAVATAVRNHPDILSATHRVAAAELAIESARRALGPQGVLSADVGATEGWDSDDYNRNASVSLSMSQTIYQGGSKLATIRRAMATRDSARGNLLTVQRDVVQGVNDAYSRFEVSRARLAATAEQVRAAQVAFDGIREEATLGARTTLDVLTAEQDLLDALTAQISARSEESIASYQLLQAQGLLTAERLGLGVQLYDPVIYYQIVKDAPSAYSKQGKDLNRVLEALGKR